MRRVLGFLLLLALSIAGISLRGHDSGKPIERPMPVPTASPPPPTPSARQDNATKPGSSGDARAAYILAMSWSPAWCADEDPSGRTDQCAIGANSGLVVHGLWPAARKDGAYCRPKEPDRLPDDLARRVRGFMPSVGLARHEWQKHGACMGLSQRGYFAAMEQAWKSFRRPALLNGARGTERVETADLRQDIARANPGLSQEAFGLQCDRDGNLSEVRLCFTESLLPATCLGDIGSGCPKSLTILSTR